MAGKKSGKKGSKKHNTYLTPGVYVEEVPSASKPIEAVGTSIAAFVGLSPANPKRAAGVVLGAALAVWAVRTVRPG